MRRTQFSLKTLLWLMAVVAFYALVAAYRRQDEVSRSQSIVVLAAAFVLVVSGVWSFAKHLRWLVGQPQLPSGKNAYCSFCRKPYKDAGPLVEGPDDVFICRECVRLCDAILDQEEQRQAAMGNGNYVDVYLPRTPPRSMTKDQRERLRLILVGVCYGMLTLAATWHQWISFGIFSVVAVANTLIALRRP